VRASLDRPVRGAIPVPAGIQGRAPLAAPRLAPDAPPLALTDVGGDPSIAALTARLGAMTTPELVTLVASGESGLVDLDALAKRLHQAKPGSTLRVPFLAVRPGQTQLSFTRAREKVPKLLKALAENDVKKDLGRALRLLDAEKMPVVLGPGGLVVLLDGHHKSAGLKMLLGFADQLYAHELPMLKKKAGPLARLHGAKRDVDVDVVANLTHLDEAAFWTALAESDDPDLQLYLARRDGTVAAHPPAQYAELEDHPYRGLAGDTVGKVEKDGKKWKVDGPTHPLWLKGPEEQNFVDFAVGAVLAEVDAKLGKTYAPGDVIAKKRRVAFAEGLASAQADPNHAQHDRLAGLVILDGKTTAKSLAKKVDVDDGRVVLRG
jgi:hypothetical protein